MWTGSLPISGRMLSPLKLSISDRNLACRTVGIGYSGEGLCRCIVGAQEMIPRTSGLAASVEFEAHRPFPNVARH